MRSSQEEIAPFVYPLSLFTEYKKDQERSMKIISKNSLAGAYSKTLCKIGLHFYDVTPSVLHRQCIFCGKVSPTL